MYIRLTNCRHFCFVDSKKMQRKSYLYSLHFKISLGAEQTQVTKIKEAQVILDLGNSSFEKGDMYHMNVKSYISL